MTPSLSPALDKGSAVRITAIDAQQPKTREGTTLVRVVTDAGVVGYGPAGRTSGPAARAAIDLLHNARLPHLGLIGKDPLAIGVHHHNMFHAYRQRARSMQVLSAIDIALWDLAGKLLGQPVHRLLGGPFRDELPLYSHATGDNPFDKARWQERAKELTDTPKGFRAFKVDIHHPLGIPMQQSVTAISPGEARQVRRYYELARESFGDDVDIIVHCHAELDVPSAIRVAAAVEPIDPLFYEDPIDPSYSESWLALRRQTRLPIMTGENQALLEDAMPFLQNQAVDVLQPDLMNAGGITGTKLIADVAGAYRIPVCLHNVSGYALNLASQQFSAAVFNCPMMECRRDADRAPEAAANVPVIKNGRMQVHSAPGLGIELDFDYVNGNRAEGEPEWH
jgi:L-alanine-DL-glutamate epimerase-like enolase superfamily enzyme